MDRRVEIVSQWRARLASAESLAAESPRLRWIHLARVRLYRFLLSCYSSGQWREDAAQGLGAIVYADGRKLMGQWRDGGLEGLGTGALPDGQKYEGEWRTGRRDGYGALTAADGKVQAGLWQNDSAVNAP